MSKIRFATARDVFEAFPSAAEDIAATPGIETPLAFIEAQAAGPTPEDAIGFCAYVLPRREAVWWACKCLSALCPPRDASEEASQLAAEAWVREPEDAVRRQALKTAETGRKTAPHTWAAFAAGWSGGSMTLDAQSVPPPAHLTGACVRICVLNALATVPARDRARHIASCIAGALSLLGATPTRPGRQQGR
ncbi:MAG: DUF6931 family protein [Alsobacter sp.]